MEKENIKSPISFPPPKSQNTNKHHQEEGPPAVIETYKSFDMTPTSPTEIEQNSKLSIYSSSKVHNPLYLLSQTCHLKHLPSYEIEKYLFSQSHSKLHKTRFITGVVVEKKVLSYSEKPSLKYPKKKKVSPYVRFKISDLKIYKSTLFEKVKELKKRRLDVAEEGDTEEEFIK